MSDAKTQVKYVNPGTYYYIDIGTYFSVLKCIGAVQNLNIPGLSLKMNALSCWKYALHPIQPHYRVTYPIVLTNAKLI